MEKTITKGTWVSVGKNDEADYGKVVRIKDGVLFVAWERAGGTYEEPAEVLTVHATREDAMFTAIGVTS